MLSLKSVSISILILLNLGFSSTVFADPVLRVCTTGDYPPLSSYDAKTQIYQGFAITIARQFGKYLNRQVVFVPSTWSNMNKDLQTKCDIAMGGITNTPGRAALFNLSENILPNHKAPIFSNMNNIHFKNFADIDKKEITIIENKGGTNEPFAKTHIINAAIEILPENAQVYACLNKYPNRKYVMFTDAIEIQYRSNQPGSILSNKGIKFKDIPNDPESYKTYMTNKTDKGKILIDAMNKFHQSHSKEFKQWYQASLHLNYPQTKVSCPF